MTNKKYSAGRRFEYEIKELFEKEGWTVFRTAGSHGLADLIAIGDSTTLLIQCKYGSKPTKEERLKLRDFYYSTGDGIHVIIAFRKKYDKKINLYTLDINGALEKPSAGWLITQNLFKENLKNEK